MKQIHLLQIIIIFSLINFIQMSEKIIKINILRNLQMQKEEGNIKNDENRDHHTNSSFSPEGNVNNSSNQNDIGKDDHDNYNENPTFNDSYIGDFDFHSSNKMIILVIMVKMKIIIYMKMKILLKKILRKKKILLKKLIKKKKILLMKIIMKKMILKKKILRKKKILLRKIIMKKII